MANNTTIYGIFESIVKAIEEKSGEKNIYLLNRPDIADKSNSFVVVNLPVQLYRNLIGSGNNDATTQGTLTLFVKSRTDGTPNINALTQKLATLVEMFPLNTDTCVCTNPRETLGGKDDYGYQFAIIRFKIRTK